MYWTLSCVLARAYGGSVHARPCPVHIACTLRAQRAPITPCVHTVCATSGDNPHGAATFATSVRAQSDAWITRG